MSPLNEIQPAEVIELTRAAVCLDCGAVFSITAKVCPACSSSTWHPLGTWLNRKGAAQ